MERRLRLLVATLVLGGAPAWGGIMAGSTADLPAAGFELGLGSWSQFASDGSIPFVLSPAPVFSGQAAYGNLPTGVTASLSLSADLAQVEGATPGVKLEARGQLWLSPGAGAGTASLELQSFNGISWTSLGRSVAIDGSAAPRGSWLRLSTLPVASNDSSVPVGSLELRCVFHCSIEGGVYFDELELGRFEYAEYALADASFEGAGPFVWQSNGPLDVHDGTTNAEGYYGAQHLTLDSTSATEAWQSLSAGGVLEWSAAEAGRSLEAGIWLRPDAAMPLPFASSPTVFVELRIFGLQAGGAETLLAHGIWHPVINERGSWRYLQADPVAPLSALHNEIRLQVSSVLPGALDVDFVQIGEQYAVDGNPRRRVGANYVGRYRSPAYPDAPSSPSSAQERWRMWRWVSPNACDSSFSDFFHDPDCATSSTCLRTNGRRDLAVTTLRGEDELPLVGAYDSRDRDVLRYHIALAQAAGIDHFIYDWLGHRLALQSINEGREPINHACFEALEEIAEENGNDFKLAVMYEPKVHFLGWVAGESTLQAKINGIIDDLVWLVEHQAAQRSALRHDGRLVVFIFSDEVCNFDGSQCLDSAAWTTICQSVEINTGEALFLIGDRVPVPGAAMKGVSIWKLVDLDLLKYRTYQDLANATPTLPLPELARLTEHLESTHFAGRDWQRGDDGERVAVAVVWPGFDDSGVSGWGVPNLIGADGLPLCVRVIDDFQGAMYPTVVASALESGADWIQIATWNDWNEDTHLEPAWLEGYFGSPFSASLSPAKVRRRVYGRLLASQAWIADFKGISLNPLLIPRIARDYLMRAASLPSVTQYD